MARVQVEHHHTGAAHVESDVRPRPAAPPFFYLAGVGRSFEDAAGARIRPLVGSHREYGPATLGIGQRRLEDRVAVSCAQWGVPCQYFSRPS